MKTKTLAGAFLATALLAGCGSDEVNEDTAKIQEENTQLKQENEEMNARLAELEQQLAELTDTTATPPADTDATGKTYTIKTIESNSDLTAYNVKEITVQETADKNVYEQVLAEILPEMPVNDVTVNDDQTVTIDFSKDHLVGPHITSSAQAAVFMDKLSYLFAENFPEVKGYYLYSDGKPAIIGEMSEFTDMIPNDQTEPVTDYLQVEGE